MEIRKAAVSDLDSIMDIYADARAFMTANGNPDQWGKAYPPREMIEDDISKGYSYICTEGERILGVFYFLVGPDPTYLEIEDGQWLNDEEYGVVHRIASAKDTKGVATFCLNWCFKQHGNIRIDTHSDNLPMNRLLEKLGYTRCGTIYVLNRSPRTAYHKCETI